MYRFKLTRTTPLYSLVNDFFTHAEEKLRSVAREATGDAEDLEFSLTITDEDGDETMDSFASYPGTVAGSVSAAEFTIESESANFFIFLTVHKENPFNSKIVISSAGAKARAHCLGIHDTLVRELSGFSCKDAVHPSSEARSFSLKVKPKTISESSLVELERHLVNTAAEHVRLPVSRVAQQLRVTVDLGHKDESYSSITQREEDFASLAKFNSISLRLSVLDSNRHYAARISFNHYNSRSCRMEIDCEGKGSREAVKESRVWLNDWLQRCSSDFYPGYIADKRFRIFYFAVGLYGCGGVLISFFEYGVSTGILLASLVAGVCFASYYGPIVWPFIRLTSEKEERIHRFRVGVFKYVLGSLLLASIVVPTVLQIVNQRTVEHG